jgi:mono/diheme cytochrome c family protein
MDPLIKVAGAAALAAVVVISVATIGPRAPQPVPAVAMPAYSAALTRQLTAYAAAVGPNAPKAETDVGGIKLRSVGFEIPSTGRAFPPGPNLEAMNTNCMSCHTPGMILNQPKLTAAEWTGEVNKMIHVYKAPVEESEVPAIVAYLAALKVGP